MTPPGRTRPASSGTRHSRRARNTSARKIRRRRAEKGDAARADLAEARAWAGRGFVGAKQVAAQNLDAALTALDRGDDALAARHAGLARDELTARRGELERIASGLRSRLARLTAP